MIDSKWFTELNEQRESWCFLSLGMGINSTIRRWEISYANPSRFVRKIISSKSEETDVIKELLKELINCRRSKIPLVTFRTEYLQKLRTRILLLGITGASLRGLRSIDIERILNEFFRMDLLDSTNSLTDFAKRLKIETKNKSSSELLWAVMLRLGPLLPEGVI